MLLTAALLPIATAFSLGGAFARSTTKKLTPYRVNTPMHYAMRQMRSRNARNIVAMNGEPMIRIGHGWDIHRLAPVSYLIWKLASAACCRLWIHGCEVRLIGVHA